MGLVWSGLVWPGDASLRLSCAVRLFVLLFHDRHYVLRMYDYLYSTNFLEMVGFGFGFWVCGVVLALRCFALFI